MIKRLFGQIYNISDFHWPIAYKKHVSYSDLEAEYFSQRLDELYKERKAIKKLRG